MKLETIREKLFYAEHRWQGGVIRSERQGFYYF